jgi:hypothetical protein
MQEQEQILTEYEFVSVTDTVYHPKLRGGKWYLVSDYTSISFDELVFIFNIPADEQVVIKLKYGG